MNNRITAGVARAKALIAQKGLPQSQLDTLHKTLDMGLDEYCLFQTHKSLASTNGILSLEEAQTVYMFLGESVDTFNNQPLEVKWVLSELFKELLAKRVA